MSRLTKDSEGTYHVEIIDEEMDAIQCKFNYDGCIHVNTDNLTYLTLSKRNLIEMLNLIEEAEEKYEEDFKNEEF